MSDAQNPVAGQATLSTQEKVRLVEDFLGSLAGLLQTAGPDNLVFKYRRHWAEEIAVVESDPIRLYVESLFAKQAEILFAEELADGRRFHELRRLILDLAPRTHEKWEGWDWRDQRQEALVAREEMRSIASKYGAVIEDYLSPDIQYGLDNEHIVGYWDK